MTRDEFENHDCSKGLEDGCNCDKVEIEDEWDNDGGNDYGYDNYAQEERGAVQF